MLLFYIKTDSSVPGIDNSIHLTHSLACYYLLSDFSWAHLLNTFTISPYYPPFFPCSSTFFYYFLGTSAKAALFGNVIFLIFLLLFTYLLASKLYSPSVALFSSLLLSFYPMTMYLSRNYFLDLPLCFFVTASLYFLVLTGSFTNAFYSILFGAACGLGMLTKWTFVFFLAVPSLFIFFDVKRAQGQIRSLQWRNALKGFFAALVICAPWYIMNASSLAHTLRGGFYLDAGHDPSPKMLLFYDYYLKALVGAQLHVYFTLLFFTACLILAKYRKSFLFSSQFLAAHLLSSYIFFTGIQNKDARFTAPFLPAVAILTAYGFSLLNIKKRELLPAAVFAICSFVSYRLYCPKPLVENWKLDEISQFLTREVPFKKHVVIGMGSAHEKLNMYTLQYYLLRTFFEQKHYFPFVIEPETTPPHHLPYDVLITKSKNKIKWLYGMSLRKTFLLPDDDWLCIYFKPLKPQSL